MTKIRHKHQARRWAHFLTCICVMLVFFAAVGIQSPAHAKKRADSCAAIQSGIASVYADKFEGRKTANGESFRQQELTAAHRLLPFGTRVEVSDIKTGEKVIVRITDRGPFVKNRVIDLSRAARDQLGHTSSGLYQVRISLCPDPQAGSPVLN
jgi:rare lipoprotein A